MINKLVYEAINYTDIHKHEKAKTNSIEWYFHNYEREPGQKNGYKHCIGHKNNPYTLDHYTLPDGTIIHYIDKEYAMGHGINRKSQWFKFNKKLTHTQWDLNSYEKVKTSDVPKEFKK
jgi:hypothetical protein